MVLHWSCWRRWHQAWARYHHYRRRQRRDAQRPAPQPAVVERTVRKSGAGPQASTEQVWQRLEPLLPPSERLGRPYVHARRLIFEAIVYRMQTNCGWRNLPSSFPAWQTVYSQWVEWRKCGIWNIIWSGFDQPHPLQQLQL
jgi:transposase